MTDMTLPFEDRQQAGRVLAEKLVHFCADPNLLVLALPRGGVTVGFEVARAVQVPLDFFVVRKLGISGHEEYAMGAISSGGVRVMAPLPGLTVAPEAVTDLRSNTRASPCRQAVVRGLPTDP